jgi:hypothetical protein
MWAYYSRHEVTVTVEAGTRTEKYIWNGRTVEFHRCGRCGCVTHWWKAEEYDDGKFPDMGVNGRLLGKEGVTGIEVRVEAP